MDQHPLTAALASEFHADQPPPGKWPAERSAPVSHLFQLKRRINLRGLCVGYVGLIVVVDSQRRIGPY